MREKAAENDPGALAKLTYQLNPEVCVPDTGSAPCPSFPRVLIARRKESHQEFLGLIH